MIFYKQRSDGENHTSQTNIYKNISTKCRTKQENHLATGGGQYMILTQSRNKLYNCETKSQAHLSIHDGGKRQFSAQFLFLGVLS